MKIVPAGNPMQIRTEDTGDLQGWFLVCFSLWYTEKQEFLL